MPNYPIPPWLGQPADPASHYATGLQIGTRIGAEQAAQQYAQQQLLMKQQEDEFNQQVESTKLNLVVGDAMRKHQAQADFQRLRQSGVPAEEALMQAGPAMGESINELMRTQAMLKNTQSRNTMDALKMQIALAGQLRQDQGEQRREAGALETAKYHNALLKLRSQSEKRLLEASIGRDKRMVALVEDLKNANASIQEFTNKKASLLPWGKDSADAIAANLKQARADKLAAQKAIKELDAKLRSGELKPQTEEGTDALPEEEPSDAEPNSPETTGSPLVTPEQIKRFKWTKDGITPVE